MEIEGDEQHDKLNAELLQEVSLSRYSCTRANLLCISITPVININPSSCSEILI